MRLVFDVFGYSSTNAQHGGLFHNQNMVRDFRNKPFEARNAPVISRRDQ